MTVEELIKALQKLPKTAEVRICDNSGHPKAVAKPVKSGDVVYISDAEYRCVNAREVAAS